MRKCCTNINRSTVCSKRICTIPGHMDQDVPGYLIAIIPLHTSGARNHVACLSVIPFSSGLQKDEIWRLLCGLHKI